MKNRSFHCQKPFSCVPCRNCCVKRFLNGMKFANVVEKEKDGIKECYQYKQFMLHEVEIRQKEKGKR